MTVKIVAMVSCYGKMKVIRCAISTTYCKALSAPHCSTFSRQCYISFLNKRMASQPLLGHLPPLIFLFCVSRPNFCTSAVSNSAFFACFCDRRFAEGVCRELLWRTSDDRSLTFTPSRNDLFLQCTTPRISATTYVEPLFNDALVLWST